MKLLFNSLFSPLLLLAFCLNGMAQTAWDDTQKKKWPEGVKEISVKSSVDVAEQKALFFAPTNPSEKRPLIVSLHTWSGDYTQFDPLVFKVVEKGYYYVHPDFRGPNNRKEATGSKLVISDIEDIIQHLLKTERIDPSEVHIVGVSGGGYATLLCYSRLKLPVKSFSAWVPISDLESWYHETSRRNLAYAGQILKSTSDNGTPAVTEMRSRSPLFDTIKNRPSELFIYTGVNDGYTGSVPITQSIRFYNKLAKRNKDKVTDKETITLLSQRQLPHVSGSFLEGRKLYVQKKSGNVSLRIFDGTHEQLTQVSLGLIPVQGQKANPTSMRLLAIGASNEQASNSWVNQLVGTLPFSNIVNYSISGNTVGFNNLDNPKLNTLRNLDSLVQMALAKNYQEPFDYITIALGTNDCKAIFAADFEVVKKNFQVLLDKLQSSKLYAPHKTRLILMTPPPIDHTKAIAKYEGGNECVRRLNQFLRQLATERHLLFLDTFSALSVGFEAKTTDGVHLSTEAQRSIAEELIRFVEADRKRGGKE